MGGGLMQLVAYGAQDIYLTGNPQITFFKVVYRRHTNFSMESIEQTFNGTVGYGRKVSATISRNGDLVHKMYLEASATIGTNKIVNANPGSALIKEVEVEIGGQQIDKHYGHWMEVWAELTQENDGVVAGATQDANAGDRKGTHFQVTTGMGGVGGTGGSASDNIAKMFIPLQFWFCRNPGLALPLIALQYHEVKVNLTFGAEADLTNDGSGTLSAALWCDYIYLDTDERRRFAQVSHEYLIEQVQFSTYSANKSHDLNLNHPVKELIWTGVPTPTGTATVGPSTPNTIYDATHATAYKLVLNGHDRFAERDAYYFSRTQVMQHHKGCGGFALAADTAAIAKNADNIGVYSFALEPEEHQPSGTCNFSRIDNAQLKITGTDGLALNIYAVNYNVLRIMSGMGGLAYSN